MGGTVGQPAARLSSLIRFVFHRSLSESILVHTGGGGGGKKKIFFLKKNFKKKKKLFFI